MEDSKELLEAIKGASDKLDKMKADKADKTEIAELQKSLNEMKANVDNITKEKLSEQLAAIKKAMEEMAEDVNAVRDNSKASKGRMNDLVEEIKKHKEEIKNIVKGNPGAKEFVLKALVDRADIANNERYLDVPEIGQLAHRSLSLYDLFPKFPVGTGTHAGVVRYYDWDEDTIVRAAAAVAEGVAFPESTAKFKKGSVSLQKIGDTLPVTEEFLEDEVQFAAELDFFLNTNVLLEVDRQLYAGDGTGNTIVGLISSINAYVPVSSAIPDPSIYDLIVKVAEVITTVGGSKYMPDFAVMNRKMINNMKLKKDANRNYVLPPFVSQDGNNVAGMRVVESNIFADNVMVVGDSRFARIYEMGGVEISRGMVGTQFTEDEMTIKARKRMAFLIKAADKGGFRKVTDISAALTTLGDGAAI